MKKVLSILVLLLTPFAFAADKPNPADYTITVHVIGSSRRNSDGGPEDLQVLIDGQPMELAAANAIYSGLFPLGDYKAKVIPYPFEPKKHDAYQIFRRYEFYLPNGDLVRQFDLIGIGETNPDNNGQTATPPAQ